MTELIPCPFCKSKTIRVIATNRAWNMGTEFYATCPSCRAEGPHAISESEAIEKWNERAK